MHKLTKVDEVQLTRSLAYAGYVLLAFEMIRSMVVEPIKVFYSNVTFGPGMPFKSYEQDVRVRHKKEFESSLLYLKDFMQAIDRNDYEAILAFRAHRNELAHELPSYLPTLNCKSNATLLDATHIAIFKISNHKAYLDIGSDPAFSGINWSTAKGHEYLLIEKVLTKSKLLEIKLPNLPKL